MLGIPLCVLLKGMYESMQDKYGKQKWRGTRKAPIEGCLGLQRMGGVPKMSSASKFLLFSLLTMEGLGEKFSALSLSLLLGVYRKYLDEIISVHPACCVCRKPWP